MSSPISRAWSIPSAFFILLTLGCSLLSQLPLLQEEANLPPTRTPFPTFTPTPAVQQQPPSNLPNPTETPIPPPTAELPTATLEPLPTDTPPPEPTATNTPEPPPPPTEPPPPPAPPTDTPAPQAPAGPVVGANGVIGKIEFRDGRNTYAVGERVFVRIEASTESGSGQITFGILGLETSTGTFQTSWSSGTINGTFTHEDGVAFNAPGTHKIRLSICFSSLEVCQGTDGNWERFEPGLDVIVQ